MDLIDKKKLLADLNGVKDVLNAAGDPFLASIMVRAIGCVERQPVVPVEEIPAAPSEAAEDKELEKAISIVRENYRKAKRLEYVRNKLGWSLYHTWDKFR